jgi:hypothetical protein
MGEVYKIEEEMPSTIKMDTVEQELWAYTVVFYPHEFNTVKKLPYWPVNQCLSASF